MKGLQLLITVMHLSIFNNISKVAESARLHSARLDIGQVAQLTYTDGATHAPFLF